MTPEAKIESKNLDFYYGNKRALKSISLVAPNNKVTALIGPSGCGKSTFIRTLNRMNDVIPGTRVDGQVLIDGVDIYSQRIDIVDLRRRIGMVFQKPNPFPKSIFDNIAYGLRINGLKDKKRSKKSWKKACKKLHFGMKSRTGYRKMPSPFLGDSSKGFV